MATAKDSEKYSFVSEPKNYLECPICLETLKTPKSLPCLHTFCEVCLHEYILTTHSNNDPVTFLCPCCREETTGPRPNIPVKEWASKFPLNRFVMPMLQDKPVPEDKIQICGPCERDGDSVNAEYWCSECNDAFCDTCLRYHGRIRNNKSHKIMPTKNMEEITPEIPYVEMTCTEHEGEKLICYCKHHKTLCCKFCLLLSDHSSCQTEAAENITEINPLRLVIESFLIDMNDLDDSAKLAMLSQRKHIEVLNSSRARSKERLTSLITSAKLRLDECHDKLNCALDQVHLEKTKQFMENENQIKRFRKILSSGQKLLHHVKEQRNAAQKVIALENTKTQIKNEIDNLKPVADEDKQTILALNFAEIFDTIKQLESVGELKIKESKSGQNVKPLFDAAKAFSNPLQHKPDIKKINLVKMFDITIKQKPRWITGGVFLKDDRLLFADRKNKKLELYDPSGIFKSAFQLNYSPWDVAFCGAENKVLVSDTDQEYIRSYAVSATEIKEEGSVKVSNRKKGMDTLGYQILCVNGKDVEVIDYNGTTSKVFQKKCESYVCASKTKTEYYCSYFNGVSCYSIAGDKVFVYSNQQLQSPRGIAVDSYGNVFICDSGSNNIHIVSEDGKQSVVIPSNSFGSVTKPYSIAINSSGNKLFLASYEESDPIEIYKILYN